jgi:hypothetical protein
MKKIRIALIAAALIVLGGVPGLTQSGQDLFQQALVKEQADGDLRAAIALYQRIVREFAGDRTLAAKALVQMGQCYESWGRKPKSLRAGAQRYADQAEAAGYARARLAAMRRPSAEAAEPAIQARRLLAGRLEEVGDFSGGPTPDGRSLIYVDSTAKNLAVRDLATGASRLITNRGSQEGYMAYSEVVSPDGRRVVYAWVRPGGQPFDDGASYRGDRRVRRPTAARGKGHLPELVVPRRPAHRCGALSNRGLRHGDRLDLGGRRVEEIARHVPPRGRILLPFSG